MVVPSHRLEAMETATPCLVIQKNSISENCQSCCSPGLWLDFCVELYLISCVFEFFCPNDGVTVEHFFKILVGFR
jgi:hypothetical protein